jgi:hypothetical protein
LKHDSEAFIIASSPSVPVFKTKGPTFIHTKQETNDYGHFFQTLLERNSNIRNIKVLGTDGEEAITEQLALSVKKRSKSYSCCFVAIA